MQFSFMGRVITKEQHFYETLQELLIGFFCHEGRKAQRGTKDKISENLRYFICADLRETIIRGNDRWSGDQQRECSHDKKALLFSGSVAVSYLQSWH